MACKPRRNRGTFLRRLRGFFYIYIMRVIIVDDEKTSSGVLEEMIHRNMPDLEIIAVCNTAADAVLKLNTLHPDLVFMDIELPGMTGFDILERVPTIRFDIIFTTAHSQFGIRAIQFSAIDYLLKPIRTEELLDAVQRVRQHRSANEPVEKIRLLLENIQLHSVNRPFNRIAFPTGDGLKLVDTGDITHCVSSSNYTTIYLKGGQKILVSKTLKEIENVLSSQLFCRVHNSHLVNIQFIARLQKGDVYTLILKDQSQVEVSRRKKDELLKMLNL
jgi:two-component system LytT family response regulator